MIVPVERAAVELGAGRCVAYPTETVYGLGADAGSALAVDHLFELKGRERERGVSVLVADAGALAAAAVDLPERARSIAEHFWPGPLTLVVPGYDPRLAPVASPRGVGFRCSSHPTAAALARVFARPIVSTSCNRSGQPPASDAHGVEAAFGPELAIAGGEPAGGSKPSTVVAVDAGGGLELLREGEIPFRQILKGTA